MEAKGFDVSALLGDKLQVWVEYNDQAMILVNYVNREQFSRIVLKATKKVWDRNHQPTEEFDNIKFGELLGVEAIADWSGFIVSGQPFPCTEDNIRLFMRKWADFAKFVSSVCTDMQYLVDTEKESARKNSGNTSGQDLTTQG